MVTSADHREFSKNIQTIVVTMVVVLWVIYFFFLIRAFAYDSDLKPFFVAHMGAGVAVPLAGLSAFLLVVILEIKSGPVEFEGPGFKLKGAAGPALFWVICFLAIVLGIKLVS